MTENANECKCPNCGSSTTSTGLVEGRVTNRCLQCGHQWATGKVLLTEEK